MNKVMINSIIYYGRVYQYGECNYFMNMVDFTVYRKDDLVNVFNISEKIISDSFVLQNDYHFVALFCVNIIDEIRNFLGKINDRYIINKIKNLNADQLYIYFQSYIEINVGEHQRWIDYERQCLIKAAIDWCVSLHIPYIV